jgi:hypothetical protein
VYGTLGEAIHLGLSETNRNAFFVREWTTKEWKK